jgi:hypothetical protein
MTPLSIFDCPLLVQPFNSLLINSLSLFVLHYPPFGRSCLSLILRMGVASFRVQNLPSFLDHLPTRPSYFLHPLSLLHYFYWPTVRSWLVHICPEGACGGQVLWLGLLSCARVR